MGTSSTVDVVVVGAGAAGLAATREARDLGLTVLALEASDRIGGRAFTDPRPFGLPWDRGCHWLHSADVNPFTPLADGYGFRYRREPPARRVHLGPRWATPEEAQAQEAFVDRGFEAALAAGRAGRDVAVASVVERDHPWIGVFEAVVHAEWGVGLEEASTGDAAAYRDTRRNWPVEDGYGALVARHAAGVEVTRSTGVERIEWGGRGVRVATPKGTLEAGATIVTVSTGVLAAGAIRFEPALPDWKLEAVAALPLGAANKVAFKIDGRRLGVEEHTSLLAPLADGTLVGFQLRPFGWDLVNGYLAGPPCRELEREGEAGMTAAMLEALTGVFGGEIASHVEATACTTWGRDPLVRGAYAAARPGLSRCRADLARPLGERLFFAGEATSPEWFSTCHGAHLSGIATARAVAAALGRT